MSKLELEGWGSELQAEALREGWYLATIAASAEPWAVHNVPAANTLVLADGMFAPTVTSAEHACLIVMRGHKRTHEAARLALQKHSPARYAHMQRTALASPSQSGWQTEFPAFGAMDVTLPAGWADQSHREEVCPKFVQGEYTLWIDFQQATLSEIRCRHKRFVLERREQGSYATVLDTDDWGAVRAQLEGIGSVQQKEVGARSTPPAG